jgi:hypothetical protein
MTVAVKRVRGKKFSKDWRDLNENWWKAVERKGTWTGGVWVDSAS